MIPNMIPAYTYNVIVILNNLHDTQYDTRILILNSLHDTQYDTRILILNNLHDTQYDTRISTRYWYWFLPGTVLLFTCTY